MVRRTRSAHTLAVLSPTQKAAPPNDPSSTVNDVLEVNSY